MRCAWIVLVASCGGRAVVDAAVGDATVDGPSIDSAVICEGIDCVKPIVCPAPIPGHVALCGRVLDTGTDQSIPCPARVAVTFYDGATVLASVDLDSCARFATTVPYPGTGTVEIVSDDPTGATDDMYRSTAVAIAPPPAGGTAEGITAYATRVVTEEMWTATSGPDPALAGESFAQHGVMLAIFRDATSRAPLAGVTVTAGGATDATRDYYFADGDPHARTTVDGAVTGTGANGSALFVDGALQQYAGTGRCAGVLRLSATMPGTIFVVEYACP